MCFTQHYVYLGYHVMISSFTILQPLSKEIIHNFDILTSQISKEIVILQQKHLQKQKYGSSIIPQRVPTKQYSQSPLTFWMSPTNKAVNARYYDSAAFNLQSKVPTCIKVNFENHSIIIYEFSFQKLKVWNNIF